MTRQREERIDAAACEGLRQRLMISVGEDAAGRWCEAWEVEAERQGIVPSADYWRHGARWIFAQIDKGKAAPP